MPPSAPACTIGGIPCAFKIDDLGQSAIVQRRTPEGTEVVARIVCDWDDVDNLAIALLGTVYLNGNTIVRPPPTQWFDNENIWCTSITNITGIKPQTDYGSGLMFYQSAVVEAVFSRPSYDAFDGTTDASGITYCTSTTRTATEVLKIPSGFYYFVGGGGIPVDNSTVGQISTHLEIRCVRHRMPILPVSRAMGLAGSVNSYPMTFGDYTFAKGELLFAQQDETPSTDPATGARTIDIGLEFRGNYNHDWNAFLSPVAAAVVVAGQGVAYGIVNSQPDGSGFFPYPYVDLRVLFSDSYP